MDNISHSLAGLIAGEIIHRSLPDETEPKAASLRRRLILLSCVIASNFPDLDLFLTPLLPEPLGYLMHHRGHTHTILYAMPQALLLLAVLCLAWPEARRSLRASSTLRKGVGFSIVMGFSLHLLMDYLNSYGIHPFHPFDSRWFYGDMVFIIEPLFWVAFGIPMAMTFKRNLWRFVCSAALIGIPLLLTIQGFLLWPSWMILLFVAVMLGCLQLHSGERGLAGLIGSALIGLFFVAIQSYSSNLAQQSLRSELASLDPDGRVLDIALSPYPTNPLCWSFVAVEIQDAQGTYSLRRGGLTLSSKWIPVETCPDFMVDREKKQTRDEGISASDFIFTDQEKGDVSYLRQLTRENCHFKTWMRFARAPVVNGTQAYDMRFRTRGPRGNFSAIHLETLKNFACSEKVPQWGFPRRDLLGDVF